MSFIEREAFITVPAELLKYNRGFGMDFGSSSVKLLYLTKEDKEQENSNDSETAKIRTITFQQSEVVEGLRFVKQRAYLFSENNEDSEVLFLTGIGCHQELDTMTEIFKMRYKILSEYDSVAAAFSYMACKVGRRYLLESRDEQAVANALKFCLGFSKFMAIANGYVENQTSGVDEQQVERTFYQSTGYDLAAANDTDDNGPLLKTEPELFPCLLIAFGSFTYSLKFTAPGEYSVQDGITSGGRMLLGVANKLVGCKTYDDLMDLTSKGDSIAVHETSKEIFRTEHARDIENIYSYAERQLDVPLVFFNCGKLVGANCDDFRAEDIASGWLDHAVEDFVRAVLLNCYVNGIKRVFLCGGVLSHPHVRRLVTEEMIKKNVGNFMLSQVQPVVFDFIKFTQQLCSLGCMAYHHQSKAKREGVVD